MQYWPVQVQSELSMAYLQEFYTVSELFMACMLQSNFPLYDAHSQSPTVYHADCAGQVL